jgi:hypothetical protein
MAEAFMDRFGVSYQEYLDTPRFAIEGLLRIRKAKEEVAVAQRSAPLGGPVVA